MSKKTKKETAPEVQNPEEQIQQPVESGQPAFVKELQEKGVVVLSGRTPEELNEMLGAISADIHYYTGAIGHYYDTGLYRIQVNRKED